MYVYIQIRNLYMYLSKKYKMFKICNVHYKMNIYTSYKLIFLSKCHINTFTHRLRPNPGQRSESMIFYRIKMLECVSTVIFIQ